MKTLPKALKASLRTTGLSESAHAIFLANFYAGRVPSDKELEDAQVATLLAFAP